ncbi:MAG TPA: hypothetical protein VGB62_07460 [Allosphingosinicella sp.]
MNDLHSYDVFGLCVASELPLPELASAPPAAEPDVYIRLDKIPASEGDKAGITMFPDGALLRIPDVGRYWMAGGRDMIVEPAGGASPRNVRLFLLGSAIAAIIHQRALLPIHANAVVIDGRAIGFMGHPGAGKSTLAAWFHDRGFRVLADDVCVVTFGPDGRANAHPGIPRLRLTRGALEASGRSAGDFEPAFDDREKYNVPTDAVTGRGSVPLDHFYLLEKADMREEAGIVRLAGADAVGALVANTYRGGYLKLMGATAPHLFACTRLARQVPVFAARRFWSLEAFDSEAGRLEAHARQIISASASA